MLIAMKRMTLAALRQDEASLLYALQHTGAVEVISMGDAPDEDDALSQMESDVGRLSSSIKFLASRQEKKKTMLQLRPMMTYEALTQAEDDAGALDAAQEYEQRMSALSAERTSLEGISEQMQPWRELEVPLEKLVPTRATALLAGLVPARQIAQLLQNEMYTDGRIVVELLGEVAGARAVFVCCLNSDLDAFYASVRDIAWVDASFPKMSGTPEEIIASCRQRIDELNAELKELEQSVAELTAHQATLQSVYDATCIKRDRQAAQRLYTHTQRAFVLEGWVRYDETDKVANAIARVTDAYSLEFRDPAEDEAPPSVARNGRLVWPYEAVTNLYSRPAPGSKDPTPWMAPFFFIFFGMMVSDAGYGVILAILATIFSLKMRPRGMMKNLGWVIAMGGISTLLWGALFGGWLAIDVPWIKPLWFNPMEEPMLMLVVCYALGLLHLFAGMALKMAADFRRGDWFAAICDTGFWYVLIIGLLLMMGGPMMGLPQAVGTAGTWMSIGGAAGLVLTQGRHKKKLLSKFTSGLLSLYNITGYLSDVLSYSRLFAMGLATGVIGMVINIIGSMIGKNIIGYILMIVVFFIGHTFNMVVNTLGAYVHSSRLQYIEFFGKFYESGGREFKPLRAKTKYVDVSGT